MIDSHLQTRKLPNQQQQQNALRKLFVVALEGVIDLATTLSYKTIVVLGNAKFLTKFIDWLPNYHHISRDRSNIYKSPHRMRISQSNLWVHFQNNETKASVFFFTYQPIIKVVQFLP